MEKSDGILGSLIWYCLNNKLIVLLFTCALIVWGLLVAPFDWQIPGVPRSPIAVDAIPDIGENQQIIFTKWPGRSPQDVEDQITYPLTVSLLGIPAVKTVRSFSFFGYSSIYVIFKEEADFYWSRSRILEKLSSLASGTLPESVTPTLGPDATALGQVFWYTLEGRDKDNKPTGGWDLQDRRTVQDWFVRYALQGVEGVSEVASIGGFVKEYQIDVDPDAMQSYGVTLGEVIRAVKSSNVDVGARTIEVNQVEYVIRGLGFIRSIEDLEQTVISSTKLSHVPVRIRDVARVALGPALRRGVLNKNGEEAVGGVATVRYGENPLAAIKRLKERITEISEGLPEKTLLDGTVSKLTIVPFYDRSGLIYETLGTLNAALKEEILVTVVMIGAMLMHLSSSLLISCLLPLSILICFIFMKYAGVDANIVALSGIAIAIGTLDDMGVVMCENILTTLRNRPDDKSRIEAVYEASLEVGSAVLTAILTTIVSFLPVFAMEGAEGKLFRPLAFTKTFTLFAAIIVSLTIIPPAAHLFFKDEESQEKLSIKICVLLIFVGVMLHGYLPLVGSVVIAISLINLFRNRLKRFLKNYCKISGSVSHLLVMPLVLCLALFYLVESWLPFGYSVGFGVNFLFVGLLVVGTLYFFKAFINIYPAILSWCLDHKGPFLLLPGLILVFGFYTWSVTGKEFMPALDEGSFLYMPTTMPHASVGETSSQLSELDLLLESVPEVDGVVGKLGRADTSLDPAPISMFEILVNYKPEYKTDKSGRIVQFKFDANRRVFHRDSEGKLIPDPQGEPYRQWRQHIKSPEDIWAEIVSKGNIKGITSAPKLQPIAARIVMLQSGMRAPMGVKIKGPSLEAIEKVGLEIEKLLKQVPSVESGAVLADRIIGKPYLEIRINREEIARYGLSIEAVQEVVEVAIGGKTLTMTVEGRERYPVRIRYPRELRTSLEDIVKILVPTPTGQQIPLGELASVEFSRKAQAIKSEDTFLVGYVVFDKREGVAEVEAVNQAKAYLTERIQSGDLKIPAGVSYSFAGSYENQLRSEKKLAIVLPLALFCIFLITYFNFGSVAVTLLVFSGVFVAWAGGFIMLWLFAQEWFFNINLFGENLRSLFQMKEYNLSVAVWVGFLALFGVATDDGVLIATYIGQRLKRSTPNTCEEVRLAVLEAGKRRVRPAVLSTATTLIALLPVLTSRGRGSDIMVPMAIPTFGGLAIALITMLVVPVLYCALVEYKLKVSVEGGGLR